MLSTKKIMQVAADRSTQRRPITPNDRTFKDFLYGFAFHYNLLVSDAKASNKKPPNRNKTLILFSKNWLKYDNISYQTRSILESICQYADNDTMVQLWPGVWVPMGEYIYDSFFSVLIGKEHNHFNARSIPTKMINTLVEALPDALK